MNNVSTNSIALSERKAKVWEVQSSGDRTSVNINKMRAELKQVLAIALSFLMMQSPKVSAGLDASSFTWEGCSLPPWTKRWSADSRF